MENAAFGDELFGSREGLKGARWDKGLGRALRGPRALRVNAMPEA